MPLRNRKPRRIVPSGISDAIDGTQAPAGAMAQLVNLIPQPNARGIMVPRPAMQEVFAIGAPDPITASLSVGNKLYMFSSSSGFDVPVLYDGTAATRIPISIFFGTSLLPATQPTTGDWQPPTIAAVAGRVVFTHPGFAGGQTQVPRFATWTGTATSGSATITGETNFTLQAGMSVSGPGVPLGTQVVSSTPVTVITTGTAATVGVSQFAVTSAAGLFVGMGVYAPGLTSNIVAISGTTITVQAGSQTAVTFSGAQVTFVGTDITINNSTTLPTSTGAPFYAYSNQAIKFGWLDISGFSAMILGSIITGIPVIAGNPNLIGIQPGMTVIGQGITGVGVIEQVNNVDFTANCGVTAGSNQIYVFDGQHDFAIGQLVSGTGIPQIGEGCFITNIDWVNYVLTISQYATTTNQSVTLSFSGGVIILKTAVTTTAPRVSFTVAGGSPTAPVWGAGDLSINPIAGTAPAVFVAQMGARAWFGVNVPSDASAGVQASDAGAACIQTNISQTLNFTNDVPVTAAAGLPLFNQLGGIIQSLIVFQGDTVMQQITGDFSTSNIGVNTLPIATGTDSPDSIASTPRGLLFAASDGLRMIDFNGQVSDPIGREGQGMVLPFQNAVTRTRIQGAFNENVYRVTISWQPPLSAKAVWGTAVRTDEFWFHLAPLGEPLERSRWTGPHTSILSGAQPWPGMSSFFVFPTFAPGVIYRGDVFPNASTAYIENGAVLNCVEQTLLLPDGRRLNATSVSEATVWVAYNSSVGEILVTATDDFGQTLDQAYVHLDPFTLSAQRPILWHNELVFRQMSLTLAMAADSSLQIGPIAMRDQELDYQLPYPVPLKAILGTVLDGGVSGP